MERRDKQERTQVEHERPLISAIYATDALNARRVHFPTRFFSSADDASVALVHSGSLSLLRAHAKYRTRMLYGIRESMRYDMRSATFTCGTPGLYRHC